MPGLAIDHLLFGSHFTDRFIVVKRTMKQTAQLFCLQTRKTLREDNSDVAGTLAL